MKTASFFTYAGPGRVSIARFAPRGTPAGFRIYKTLAPGSWFNSVSKEEYERLYFDGLAQLDPKETWDRLHDLAGGAEPVLLCWEKPPFDDKNWCHRRMVAKWFQDQLGVDVPELTVPAQQPEAA